MIPLFNSIQSMLNSITSHSVIGKIGILSAAFLTAFLTPIVGLLVTCFVFTVVDMVYGIKVAKRQNKKITSDANWHGTIRKIIDEFTVIGLARLLEYTVLGSQGVFVLTGGVTIIVGLTELWSILENLNTLNPKGPWRVLSRFLTKKGEDLTGINLEEDEHTNDSNVVENSSELAEKPL